MTDTPRDAIRHALGPGAGVMEVAQQVYAALHQAGLAAERQVHVLAAQKGQVLRELAPYFTQKELGDMFGGMSGPRVAALIKAARDEWPDREPV